MSQSAPTLTPRQQRFRARWRELYPGVVTYAEIAAFFRLKVSTLRNEKCYGLLVANGSTLGPPRFTEDDVCRWATRTGRLPKE